MAGTEGAFQYEISQNRGYKSIRLDSIAQTWDKTNKIRGVIEWASQYHVDR